MKADAKKLTLLLIYIVLLILVFLSQSRYPRLSEKSLSGERVSIASPLTHEAILPINKSVNFLEILFKEEVNWLYTNLWGMIFGILISAAFMTLLQLIKKKNFKGPFLNSFIGVLMGAPLGICVNCATPIFQGLVKTGRSASFAMALMQSSPVLNFIVIGLSFSLFPAEFVLLKIFFTLFYLLIILPKITRNLPTLPQIAHVRVVKGGNSWEGALVSNGKAYLKNLIYLLKATIPLLLLAGLLGISLIKIFPIDLLKNFSFDFKSIFLIAILGSLLPVPMAMDVILTFILMNMGLPIGPAMTLFFCLGIFSIYPFFLIWKEYSVKMALLILSTIISLGIFSGYVMGFIQEKTFSNTLALITSKYNNNYRPDNFKIFSAIVDSCSKQFKNKEREDCERRFLGKEVALGVGSSICNYLLDQTEKEKCNSSNTYRSGKKKISGAIRCIKEKKCDRSVLQEISELSNTDLCRYFEGESRCLLFIAINKIKNGHSKSVCETLKSFQEECLEFYSNLYNLNKSIKTGHDFCHGRKDCYQDWFKHNFEKRVWDREDCDSFKTEIKNKCIEEFILFQSISKMDFNLCRKINDILKRDRCQELVVYQKFEKKLDISLCEKLEFTVVGLCQIRAKNLAIEQELQRVRLQVFYRRFKKGKFNQIESRETIPIRMKENELKESFNLGNIKISQMSYKEKKGSSNNFLFEKYEGPEFGIVLKSSFSPSLRYEPFVHSFPIASGDLNNDLYPDLAIGVGDGILLAINMGNLRFKTQKIFIHKRILLVALVDLNNDGDQDLFFSTYKGGSFYIPNRKGHLSLENAVLIDKSSKITMAASFGDLNRDGHLDIAMGNWTIGTYGRQLAPFESSKNEVFISNGKSFSPLDLSYLPKGETLTALFSDINSDNRIDLAFGNDFEGPDTFYFNLGRKLVPLFSGGPIPLTSKHTMSIDTADINNDLVLDIFSVDLDPGEELERNGDHYCKNLKLKDEIKKCQQSFNLFSLARERDSRGCESLSDDRDTKKCLSAILLDLAIELKSRGHCEGIPEEFKLAKDFCLTATSLMSKENKSLKIFNNQIPQSPNNVLALGSNTGKFLDQTKQWGVKNTGWSWNAKFADLNNDEFQDLYIANGMFNTNGYTPNQFYLNREGKTFENISKSSGLDDLVHTSSYTYADLDLDGDLDIVSTGLNAPLRFFINQENNNNSITFILRNKLENYFNIGAKVIISYGENKKQIRELKLGGGFQSFDNPVAHFGLGKHKEIKGFEIIWPSGKKERVLKKLPAGKIYLVELK